MAQCLAYVLVAYIILSTRLVQYSINREQFCQHVRKNLSEIKIFHTFSSL